MVLTSTERSRAEVRHLWPRGPIWSPQAPRTAALIEALAAEAERATDHLGELRLELDPRTTSALLPRWEEIAGLPDPCALNLTTEDRRKALVARLTSIGGASIAFFVDVAAALGFDVWIEEHAPDPFLIGQTPLGHPLGGEAEAFVWTVHAPTTTVHYFRIGQNAMGDPLRWWGSPLLECALAALAPAHTKVEFAYDSTGATILMAVPGGTVELDSLGAMLVPGGRVETDGLTMQVPGGVVELENQQ